MVRPITKNVTAARVAKFIDAELIKAKGTDSPAGTKINTGELLKVVAATKEKFPTIAKMDDAESRFEVAVCEVFAKHAPFFTADALKEAKENLPDTFEKFLDK